FPLFSPTGRLSRPSRRRRLVLNLSQKDTLQALFQQNPYPGITTREWLARELDIPESRIQVQPSLSIHFPSRGPCPDARRKRTFISPSQTRVLVQAFERDRFPSIAAREELAHQTGIPEPRIQVQPSLSIHFPSRGPCPDASRPTAIGVLALGLSSSAVWREVHSNVWSSIKGEGPRKQESLVVSRRCFLDGWPPRNWLCCRLPSLGSLERSHQS
uniref:Homeobox domain-containing protein n=1 Tax=Phocoena sinus TaxID=42100 RepID=A0A8C9DY25_PHOSS